MCVNHSREQAFEQHCYKILRLQLVGQAAGLLQRDELLRDLLEGDHLALRLCTDVVPVANVDRLAVELLLSDNCTVASQYIHNVKCHNWRTKDEVVLCDLAVADLLVERLGAVVDVDVQTELGQLLADLSRILLLSNSYSAGCPMDVASKHLRRAPRRGRQGLDAARARTACKTPSVKRPRDARSLSATHHLPAKCSVMMAMNRSRLPRIARWMMTGRDGGLSGFCVSSGARYLRLKRSGSWKSSWIVAHWNERRSASRTLMSILGP